MVRDRNGMEVLEREDCLALLGGAHVGRVAVTMDALPVVLPVTFVLTDDGVVFRTRAGTKLDAATSGAVVAFEVDDVDPVDHTGWSVLVTGVGRAVADPGELAPGADRAPRWLHGGDGDDRWVVVPIDVVTGRRLP